MKNCAVLENKLFAIKKIRLAIEKNLYAIEKALILKRIFAI